MPGLVSGDTGFMDDSEDSFQELSNSSHQRFNILCSGDKDGFICFSIFGIFPIGKINIHNFCAPSPLKDTEAECRLLTASVYKVALSKDLCHLIVMCSGELIEDTKESENRRMTEPGMHGLHCIVLDTSIFWKRKNELHQVAQQASNIEELAEVILASLSVMHKWWSDAMRTFHDKFDSLSNLIMDHGLDSCPQEEFLSLLGGARTSPAVHQFIVNSLGEVGVKRVSKAVCGAGKELQLIILNHLQPAAEIIAFRMGELRGLSRWRAHYQEKAGMIRFIRVVSSVVQQFLNFFNWLLKCIKLLNSEPSDHHLLLYNSELVVIFLKFLYDQDPARQLLEASEADESIEIGLPSIVHCCADLIPKILIAAQFKSLGLKQRFLSLSPPMSSAFVKSLWEGIRKPVGIKAVGTIVVCAVMLHSKFGPDGVLASRMEKHAAAQVKLLSEANEGDKKRF
ncbi:hypothetical protein M0R45_013112 [Rubus argutus]|uniref:Anaphase-promoting complex subunit 4 n=1 Tax=Rubus argutus TaxID=59490 RepID=A0AAW1XH87_RUBAR